MAFSPTVTIDTVAGDDIIDLIEAQNLVLTGTATDNSLVVLFFSGLERRPTLNGETWSYAVTAQDLTAIAAGGGIKANAYNNAYPIPGSAVRSVTVDTTPIPPPPAPTINTVAGDNVVNLRESESLVLTGKTEGVAVKLTLGGREHVVAANGGAWSYTATAEDVAAMGQGGETVKAVALNGVGGGGVAATREINVDTIPPKYLSTEIRYTRVPLDSANNPSITTPAWGTGYRLDGSIRYVFDEPVVFTNLSAHGTMRVLYMSGDGIAAGSSVYINTTDYMYFVDPQTTFTMVFRTNGKTGRGELNGEANYLDAAGNLAVAKPADPIFTFAIKVPLQSGGPAAQIVNMAGWAIGSPMTSIKAADATIALADGSRVDNPLFAVAASATKLGSDYAAGKLTVDQAREALIDLAVPTTGVAHDAYLFFTGRPPSSAGMAWLIDSATNLNDLTDAHYAGLNTINRYINLAVGLGTVGEGQAAFAADYGALSFQAAIAKAYETIIGGDEARAAGLDVPAALAWINSQKPYFQALGGGTDLGAKAAMVGYVLSAGEQAHVGAYYEAAHDFIGGLIGLVGASDASFPDHAG